MSILRTRSTTNYRCYLVRPVGNFNPHNWQEKPARYTILERVGETNRLGKADANRFLHNHAAIENGTANQCWFVVLK